MSSNGRSKPGHRRLREDRRNPAGSSPDAPGQSILGLSDLEYSKSIARVMRDPTTRYAAVADFKKRGRLTWQRERRILAWEDGAGTSSIEHSSSVVNGNNKEIRRMALERVRLSVLVFASRVSQTPVPGRPRGVGAWAAQSAGAASGGTKPDHRRSEGQRLTDTSTGSHTLPGEATGEHG